VRVQGTVRILLIALLACVALPAAADAATVSRAGDTLRYKAGKGERISWQVTETSDGVFLTRVAKNVRQRLIPGAGCKRRGAHEIRCAGQGVARVKISLTRARRSAVDLRDVRVAVAATGSKGINSVSVSRAPDFSYTGGPGRDDVSVGDNPGGHSTIRLGAGADFFSGQPESALGTGDSAATSTVDGGAGGDSLMGGPGADSLDGGTGSDTLVCEGGADTLTGGSGTDTVAFAHFGLDPAQDGGAISVTLDGRRNDGTAGQNALVGSDVENATIGPTMRPSGDDVVVGNEGPNLLIGPGTVRGLGGNDILIGNNLQGAGTTLDGGDGDDRIDALAWDTASAGSGDTPASVVCGSGADVVFTTAAIPADCERANVGMHVLGARPIGPKGLVRARIDCTDPHGCVMRTLLLKRSGHQASITRTRVIRIRFGKSRTASAQILPRVWKRHRHARSLRFRITPVPQATLIVSPAVSTGSYSRALTVRISR